MLPINEAISFVKERLDTLMRTGSYALGFIIDLAMVMARGQDNLFQILEEVAAMEGSTSRRSTTKPAEPFKRNPLWAIGTSTIRKCLLCCIIY